MTKIKTGKRVGMLSVATLISAATLSLGGALAASAHVGLSGSNNEAGSSSLLTFAFSHGCDGSPTNKVAIQIPEGINSVTPTVNAGWTVEKKLEELATPITDGHGNQVTKRVSEVVYTAKTPIADGLREAFVLSLKLPEDAAGKTIAFPTVQSCVSGEHAWIQIAAEGQDPHDLDSPAPTISVVEASGSEHGDGHGDADKDNDGHNHADAASEISQDPFSIIALIAGVLGLLLGATALIVSRKKKA